MGWTKSLRFCLGNFVWRFHWGFIFSHWIRSQCLRLQLHWQLWFFDAVKVIHNHHHLIVAQKNMFSLQILCCLQMLIHVITVIIIAIQICPFWTKCSKSIQDFCLNFSYSTKAWERHGSDENILYLAQAMIHIIRITSKVCQ